jgi:hypothetical protein
VRTAWSILLLVVFGTSLIGPALSADGDSNLPACCRRNGRHQCAMIDSMGQQESPAGPAIQSARMKCPVFPKVGPVSAYSKAFGLRTSEAIFASIVRHPAVQPQIEALYRVSFSRASQKRGPPSLLS